MPLTFLISEPGAFSLADNGVIGDNTSVLRGSSSAVSVVHPADSLKITAVAGVTLAIDVRDSFNAASLQFGDLADSTQCFDRLDVGEMVTSSTAVLASNGLIRELNADPDTDIVALTSIALSAVTGIGTNSALELETAVLEAETTSGGIDLVNLGAVTIGALTSELRGLFSTSGDVRLVNYGSVTLADETGLETVRSGGDLDIVAVGLEATIRSIVDQDALSCLGDMKITAGQDVIFGDGGADFDNDVRAGGEIKIVAGRDFTIDGFSDMASDDQGLASNGGITITAGRNVNIDDAFGSDASIAVSASASTGSVRITTGFGGLLSLHASSTAAIQGRSAGVAIEADRVDIESDSGISCSAGGGVVIRPRTEGRRIDLGAAADPLNNLSLSDAELDRIFTAGQVTVGGAGAGQVTVTGAISHPNPNLALRSGSNIVMAAGGSVTGTNLGFFAADDILFAPAAFVTATTFEGFVDFEDDDAGAGGKALVSAGLAQAVRFVGAGDDDTLQGGAGADTLDGGGGADLLTGRAGDDTYRVTAGDIVVELVGQGVDTVVSAADWTLEPSVENLTLIGAGDIDGAGNDLANLIAGNNGDNQLSGAQGNDTLSGANGKDLLEGGKDRDRLNGGAGADTLSGGQKNDKLTGGDGGDFFLFDRAPNTASNNDEILDYDVAADSILLDDAVFTAFGSTGTIGGGNFVLGAAAADGDDFIIYDSATGAIFYDPDGSGGADQAQLASVDPGTALTRFDFVVV